MAIRRFPILTWSLPDGGAAAVLAGDLEPAAASGSTEADALRQLKELIEWRFEHEPWNADADLLEPKLLEVKVEVRPRYASLRRVVPCPETLWLRVPCVVGRQESGIGFCAAPHLQVQFNFNEAAALKDLVAHYVNEALQGLAPAELLMRRPPEGCRLGELAVRQPGERLRAVPAAERRELQVLFKVADPLLLDQGRKRSVSAAYGRDPIVRALLEKLASQKANVLLVGEPGVGKSTVLFEAVKTLARRPAANAGPENRSSKTDDESTADLRRYRYWRTSASRLIAGMRYLGEWEERCEEFVGQLRAIEGVFCAENLLELLSVGGQGPGDSVGAFLLPFLQRGELRLVAECTPDEVEACRRLLPGLLEMFQIVTVAPFDDAEAMRVLGQIADSLAAGTKIAMEPGAVATVHRLFRRFQPYAALPGPAAGFVRQLCTARLREAASSHVVRCAEVVTTFARKTGLPELFLRDELPLVADALRATFAERIIGQPEATATAARLMATIKAGLTDPGRPPGVLLFCGPTGVGKTALARLLADQCFGAGTDAGARAVSGGGSVPGSAAGTDRLVRLDMSEYAGWGAAQRFLQDPQGRPAPWIERVRRQPFCVVLFDEIEKAAPEVFDVLLSLLDEGRLTDRFGRVTWFRSAIVILTSNLGASTTDPAGFAPVAELGHASAVAKFFRPEFFNRLDSVVTFKPLERGEVRRIAGKELSDLAAREGLAAAGLQLQWSERLVDAVATAGYDQRLGARPLQRALERLVVTPLARWRMAHPAVAKAVLHLDWIDHRLTVKVTRTN